MYTCNITEKKFDLKEEDKNREGGNAFGYNCRFRAICYLLSKMLYNDIKILTRVPINKKIKGIGMSDSSWAEICKEKYDYVNTHNHAEPKLDIYEDTDVNKYTNLDFIICSDIFQFISPYPNLQQAFNNLYKMLKIGGVIIFSVPFHYLKYQEYYPNLYDYKVIEREDEKVLINTTIDKQIEYFENLKFHGKNGTKLEKRTFSKSSLIKYFCDAGFIDIEFHKPDEDMNKYGIFWENNCSLIITAKK
jgi:hypothetical protein